jgi:Icc-related predicted phosphoesterase
MKIYTIADLHGSQYRLNIVLDNIKKYNPDLVVICGDITQFGPGDLAKNFLDQIPTDTFAITGNIDTLDVIKGIKESKATFLELNKIKRYGYTFVGTNGIDNNQVEKLDNKKYFDEKTILITHIPPYETQDKVFVGVFGGSIELRNLIEKYKPILVLCGHIHENPGYIEVFNSIIVNCSMGKRGEGAIIEIKDKIYVKMLV